MSYKIKVLVVDDSAVVRLVLSKIINSHPSLEVVATAADPYIARDKIKQLKPDVLTLDIEMPRMDGHAFLKNLMRLHPLPVVMISTLTANGADATLKALELGAVDFICKPSTNVSDGLNTYAKEICKKLIAAASIDNERLRLTEKKAAKLQSSVTTNNIRKTNQILAIGASTGGTIALQQLMSSLPHDTPGTVIVQHIPGSFSAPFAKRLNENSAMEIKEAQDGDKILQGHAYVAPGTLHLSIYKDGAFYRCRLADSEPVNRHKPSVDVLFHSVAKNAPNNSMGVILTGMGSDGAEGLLGIRKTGSPTVAQDEASSVVWGMPGSAVDLDAVDDILPLDEISSYICQQYSLKNVA